MHICKSIGRKIADMKLEMLSLVLRLDCLSCVLTVFSTILVGRRCWEGWVLAAANSVIICAKTALRLSAVFFVMPRMLLDFESVAPSHDFEFGTDGVRDRNYGTHLEGEG